MEMVAMFLTMAGGLVVSVACGLVMEELIFGGLVRLFFAQQRSAGGEGKEREKRNGGRSC